MTAPPPHSAAWLVHHIKENYMLNPPSRPQPADPRPESLQYEGLFQEPQYPVGVVFGDDDADE